MKTSTPKPVFHYREPFHNVITCDMTLATADGHPLSQFSSNLDRVTCQLCLRVAAHALNTLGH